MALDKAIRNTLRNTITECRRLLEEAVGDVLEGQFGVHRDGRVEPEAAVEHLSPELLEYRAQVLAHLDHIRAAGFKSPDAVAQLIREASYTHLNRLCAYKMLERRRLIREAVGRGLNSTGFKFYLAEHPEDERLWSTGKQDGAYRHFLMWVGEQLSAEIGVLFSPTDPANGLFPPQVVLDQLLALLNDEELQSVWDEEETIGWVYQYYTPKELRDKARKESAAPRNAYELAFRNQFYTPRYVVEFLVENTLGRIWYEMCRGETSLADPSVCRYLVRRKHPIWLKLGEPAPTPVPRRVESGWRPPYPIDDGGLWVMPNREIDSWSPTLITYALTVNGYELLPGRDDPGTLGEFVTEKREIYDATGKWEGTFEELRACLFWYQRAHYWNDAEPEGDDLVALLALNRAICDRWDFEVETISFRAREDPRTLRVLDPACGSGHFLLYAFDLLLRIYREAWEQPGGLRFEETDRNLRRDYPDETEFAKALPGLILRHNLHGIDIDLRATQVAALVLWLRAQRAYSDFGLRANDRTPISRVNVVVAEPLPGERDMLADFLRTLDPPVLAELVSDVWEGMAGVGEIGSLLKAETLVHQAVSEAKREWQSGRVFDQVTLFAGDATPRQHRLDLSFISDEAFWHDAERQVREALRHYAEATNGTNGYRRRIFADDAAQGFAFLELFNRPFDVVLMNPPFGAVSHGARSYIERHYPKTKNDLYAAFVERGLEALRLRGYIGAITSRTGFFLTSFQKWREEIVLAATRIHAVADLGQGVLDTAMVETAAYTLERRS